MGGGLIIMGGGAIPGTGGLIWGGIIGGIPPIPPIPGIPGIYGQSIGGLGGATGLLILGPALGLMFLKPNPWRICMKGLFA